MRELTIADFAPRRGSSLGVETGGGLVQLALAEVQALPASMRAGGAFRLEFNGPPQPILRQGTYRFHLGGERHDIFIVPLGPTAAAMRYEAIFF